MLRYSQCSKRPHMHFAQLSMQRACLTDLVRETILGSAAAVDLLRHRRRGKAHDSLLWCAPRTGRSSPVEIRSIRAYRMFHYEDSVLPFHTAKPRVIHAAEIGRTCNTSMKDCAGCEDDTVTKASPYAETWWGLSPQLVQSRVAAESDPVGMVREVGAACHVEVEAAVEPVQR